MFIAKTVILSIVVGVLLFEPAQTGNVCGDDGDFSVERLEGRWWWVAYVDEPRNSLRCGEFTSRQLSNTQFVATRSVLFDGNNPQKFNIKGVLKNFDLTFRDAYLGGPDVKMHVSTCNDTQEFALQLQDTPYYTIYSKRTTISKAFYRHYQKIADASNLQLLLVDNSNCN